MIPGYIPYFAGEGKGKGVAVFVKKHLVKKDIKTKSFEKEDIQGLKLYFPDIHILNIYRPPNQSPRHLVNFLQVIKENIDPKKPTIVCGDMNFNILKDRNHRISVMLKELGFEQVVEEPTTIYGSCLDQVYLRTNFLHKHKLYHPYYSDHECVCLMLKKPVITQ